MVKIDVTDAQQHFTEVVDMVRDKNETVVVTGPDGELVKIVPVPKPIDSWKGRPVYRAADVQYLDFPYW